MWWRSAAVGQFLPRWSLASAAALAHKAAAPTVRHRASYGPKGDISPKLFPWTSTLSCDFNGFFVPR